MSLLKTKFLFKKKEKIEIGDLVRLSVNIHKFGIEKIPAGEIGIVVSYGYEESEFYNYKIFIKNKLIGILFRNSFEKIELT